MLSTPANITMKPPFNFTKRLMYAILGTTAKKVVIIVAEPS